MNFEGGIQIANAFDMFMFTLCGTKNAYFHFLIKTFLKYNIFA
jgi:hypothetical protein